MLTFSNFDLFSCYFMLNLIKLKRLRAVPAVNPRGSICDSNQQQEPLESQRQGTEIKLQTFRSVVRLWFHKIKNSQGC